MHKQHISRLKHVKIKFFALFRIYPLTFQFAPLAVTAIVGSVQQKKLPGEIFDHIERYVASGGNDLYLGTDFVNASNGNIICPHCKNEVPAGNA